jgi:hypothetical protein
MACDCLKKSELAPFMAQCRSFVQNLSDFECYEHLGPVAVLVHYLLVPSNEASWLIQRNL